ncbi:hypothetical protein [Streptohalobacillus salinus]|uniref:hypothetical protein n=1 Tax=Streptohalobacillus salinus TaxID=621096 RepID=UPI000D758623|nr:hypothetical protein [Streptohalobacillus salinus]
MKSQEKRDLVSKGNRTDFRFLDQGLDDYLTFETFTCEQAVAEDDVTGLSLETTSSNNVCQ